MKRLLILILSSIIFLIGCAYFPVSSETPADNDYSSYKLPTYSHLSVETVFSKTGMINNEEDGIIRLKNLYWLNNNQLVKANAKLTNPKNVFAGSVIISMKIDDEYVAASLETSMTFDKTPGFDFEINGLDYPGLIQTSSGVYNFICIDDNGNTENVKTMELT